ncbi:Baeyer-Villiger monooxygenase [Hypsizygus marmoreus]|uniref:Baeyer-Villiger monooxygenase n=1 Tax=Hypsizygus marmoreus TaxID=39966 RepID=A0A369JL87_HYPMA|nr:Baeyer-Villiger monooxygenase [Hypsizygus marmoreus]
MSSTEKKRVPHVIIVGAGLAGISTAIQLKRQLGFENFTIYEKASAVGGTWRDNTYPGCGSDVPGHWYSLSTDLNPRWSTYYVDQPEIRAYWEDLYQKYNLPSHTKLGYGVVSAEWDSDSQLYRVVVRNTETGEETQAEANILIYAIGGFMSPLFPKDIEGVEKFRGLTWHSAQWRHDVDLKGKRVGVIGNGCSAAQFVPEISVDPSVEVINFCRTPQWYIPRANFRNIIMARSDIVSLIFNKDNKRLLAMTKKTLSRYIAMTAPRDQVAALTPDYTPGCKRIIVDPGYLESLHRPNVSLRWDAIKGIVENGIELKTGEIVPLDVIIFGTGYCLEPTDLRVQGRRETIHEYFASKGGPTAYIGTCMPGFPNCFTILGPNVATGHASVIFSQEAQIGLVSQLIQPIIQGKAKSFEVTEEATDEYNTWLQKRLTRSVWTECNSYYQVGGQKETRITATFPGPVGLFWWLALRPRWSDFRGVAGEAWEKQRRKDNMKKRGILVLVLALAAGLGFVVHNQSLYEVVRRIKSVVL